MSIMLLTVHDNRWLLPKKTKDKLYFVYDVMEGYIHNLIMYGIYIPIYVYSTVNLQQK